MLGGLLYYLFSPEVVFIKIIDTILQIDFHITGVVEENVFGQFIRYYFLDMLWGYALVFALFFIMGNNTAELKKIFLIASFFSAIMEILQAAPFAKGTFDVCDIGVELLAEILAVYIIKNFYEEEQMKKKLKLPVVVICLVVFAAMALGSGSSDSGSSPPEEEQKKVSIEEQILFNQEEIIVTAKEYVTDSIWGEGIKMLIENNSDKNVTVSCNALIVNNYMISDLFVEEVSAGKKANEVLYLSSSALKRAGIESVGQVEIYFHVYESETYDTIFNTECITIKTSEFANMNTVPADAGTELYNADGIRIVEKEIDKDSIWGTEIFLFCENTSGRNVTISIEELSINGFMVTPLFSATVYDGKMAIKDMTISSSSLENNGIEAIETVELKFHIYDSESYSTIANSEAITFTVE